MGINASTIGGIRSILIEQTEKLASGNGDVVVSSAIANLAGKLFKSIDLEVSYAAHIRKGGRKIEMME